MDPEKDSLSDKMDGDIEKQAQDSSPPQEAVVDTQQEVKDPSLVEFDGPDDPDNPKNWSPKRRVAITMSMGMMTFVVTFASSIFSVAIGPVAEEYNVGIVTATLGVALFILVRVRGFQNKLITKLIKFSGICHRSRSLWPSQRSMGSQSNTFLWLHLLRRLPDTRCRCAEH